MSLLENGNLRLPNISKFSRITSVSRSHTFSKYHVLRIIFVERRFLLYRKISLPFVAYLKSAYHYFVGRIFILFENTKKFCENSRMILYRTNTNCEKFFWFEMTENVDMIFNRTIEPSKTLLGDCAT